MCELVPRLPSPPHDRGGGGGGKIPSMMSLGGWTENLFRRTVQNEVARGSSFRCHHTRTGAPYSRPVPLPPYVSSIFPPSSSPPSPPPTPPPPLSSNQLHFVCVHPSSPLFPPPAYSTPWGRSPSYPPCLSGGPFSWRNGASNISPPLLIDSIASLWTFDYSDAP